MNDTTKPSRSKSKRPAATPSDISSVPPLQLDQCVQLSDRNTPQTLRDVEQLAVSMLASLSQSLQAKNEQSAKQLWEYGSKTVLTRLASSPPPTPYTGRSVAVNGQNFAYAYRELNGILRDNNVRRTIRGQERHEKKGVKRRRIASQTHRRKFGQLVRSESVCQAGSNNPDSPVLFSSRCAARLPWLRRFVLLVLDLCPFVLPLLFCFVISNDNNHSRRGAALAHRSQYESTAYHRIILTPRRRM